MPQLRVQFPIPYPECKQRLVETCQNQPGKKLAKLTAVGVDDEAAAGVGAPAWQRHGPKMIWPCILNASKKWMRVARMNLENKHARLTMVPVDDKLPQGMKLLLILPGTDMNQR